VVLGANDEFDAGRGAIDRADCDIDEVVVFRSSSGIQLSVRSMATPEDFLGR
jgi:hypothetical protein